MKVFLGGTCAGSKWREELIPKLKLDYFNPVVDDWDEMAYMQELYEREHCDFVLYTITPEMQGVYSIAEVVDDSNKRPHKTILCILGSKEDFDNSHFNSLYKALTKVGLMVRKNGGKCFDSLTNVALYLNRMNRQP